MNTEIHLTLNWPPSVNQIWRRNGAQYFVSAKGIAYRQHVRAEVLTHYGRLEAFAGALLVHIDAYPPSHRRHDLDNILKSLLDSLTHAGIYDDDHQVAKIIVERREVAPPGRIEVTITPWVGVNDGT